MLAAVLAAGAVAAAFGWFVVRLSGVYLAMLTLAFAQIVWAVALQWSDFTGGDNGILGVWPRGALATRASSTGWHSRFAPRARCCCAACSMRRSATRCARCATPRCAPRRSACRRTGLRLAAFVIAGAAAGLSGALSAFSKGSVFPATISIGRSVDALLMVLLGGVQTMTGPIVGALVYTGLYDALLLATSAWRLALGAAIVLLVLAFPQGIAGAVQQAWRRAA